MISNKFIAGGLLATFGLLVLAKVLGGNSGFITLGEYGFVFFGILAASRLLSSN